MNDMKLNFELNIVSLLNLAALLGVLITAIGTFYALRHDVDKAMGSMEAIRSQIESERRERRENVASLLGKFEASVNMYRDSNERTVDRLATIEAKQTSQAASINRIEAILDRLVRFQSIPTP